MTLQQPGATVMAARRPTINVGLGLLAVGGPDEELVIYGLGSCIGLALWSQSKRIGVLCHIVMSNSRGTPVNPANPAKFADWAVPQALEAMMSRGVRRSELVAKLAGGAHTLNGAFSNSIGTQNTEVTLAALDALRIPVLGRSVGGTVGRTMRFYTGTGKVDVRHVNGITEEL